MKLHLPSSLRKALLTCLATLAAHVALPLTVSTGTLISSGALVSFLSAQHALAEEDGDEDEDEYGIMPLAFSGPENVTSYTSDTYTDGMTITGNVEFELENSIPSGSDKREHELNFGTTDENANLKLRLSSKEPQNNFDLKTALTLHSLWITSSGENTGRLRASADNLSGVENIYVNDSTLWINDGGTLNSNFYLGTSTWDKDGEKNLAYAALRISVDVTASGTLTLMENAAIAIQSNKTLTVNGKLQGDGFTLNLDNHGNGYLKFLGGGTIGGFTFNTVTSGVSGRQLSQITLGRNGEGEIAYTLTGATTISGGNGNGSAALVIDSNTPVTLEDGASITLGAGGTLTNNSTMLTLNSGASITLESGGTLTNNGTLDIDAGTLYVAQGAQNATLGGTGTVEVGDGGSLTLRQNAQLTVSTTAVFTMDAGSSLNIGAGACLTLENATNFTINERSTFSLSAGAQLLVNGGTLSLGNAILEMASGSAIVLGSTGARLSLAGLSEDAAGDLNIAFGFDLSSLADRQLRVLAENADVPSWFTAGWNQYIDLSRWSGLTFHYADGVLSWDALRNDVESLVWGGEDLTWTVGSGGWQGESNYFINGDTVTFGNDPEDGGSITLGENITAGGMTVNGDYEFLLDGHTLTVSNGGITVAAGATLTFGESAGSLVLGNGGEINLQGTLVLKPISADRNAKVLWQDTDKPTINAGDDACIILDFSGPVRGDQRYAISSIIGTAYNKRLEIKGTILKHSGSQVFSELVVHDGAQLFLNGNYAGNVSIAGMTGEATNGSGDYHGQGHAQDGALRLSATLSGQLTLNDNAAVTVHSGETGTISGNVTSADNERFALYKHGNGALNLTGSISDISGIYIRHFQHDGNDHGQSGHGGSVTLTGSLDVGTAGQNFVFSTESNSNTITFEATSASMTGGATVHKQGAGTVSLGADLSGFNGSFVVEAGVLRLRKTVFDNDFSISDKVTGTGGILALGGAIQTEIAGGWTFGGGLSVINGSVVNLTGNISVAGLTCLGYEGGATGTGKFTATGVESATITITNGLGNDAGMHSNELTLASNITLIKNGEGMQKWQKLTAEGNVVINAGTMYFSWTQSIIKGLLSGTGGVLQVADGSNATTEALILEQGGTYGGKLLLGDNSTKAGILGLGGDFEIGDLAGNNSDGNTIKNKKTGGGVNLTLNTGSSDKTFSGKVKLDTGVTLVKTGAGTWTVTSGFSSAEDVLVQEGAFAMGDADAKVTYKLKLDGGDYKQGMAASATTSSSKVEFGGLVIGEKGGSILWSSEVAQQDLIFGSLTGAGNLNVGQLGLESGASATNYRRLTFTTVTDFHGTVTGSYVGNGTASDQQYSRVIIGHVNQASGKVAKFDITGGVYTTDFQKTGDGSLTLTKLHVRGGTEGKLYMNYTGTLNITGGVTLTAGNTLVYEVADDPTHTIDIAYSVLADVMAAQGNKPDKFILDLNALTDEALKTGVYLGITGAENANLNDVLSFFDIDGLDSDEWHFEVRDEDGKLYVTTGEVQRVDIAWDPNWKTTTHPRSMQQVTRSYDGGVDEDAYKHIWELSSDDVYVEHDGQVYLTGENSGGEGFIVLGGVFHKDANSLKWTEDKPTWIMVKGGTYHILVGGSSCLASGGAEIGNKASGGFEGNSHIQVEGGTVDYIVGGNHINNSSFSFHGNSYISVMDGAKVNGGIVGGSTLTKGSNNSQIHAFNGDSNIFIYTVLGNPKAANDMTGMWDGTESAGDGDGTKATYGAAFTAIVGGNAWIDRAAESVGKQMNPSFNGHTNITIDLRNNTAFGTFDKDIVGGNYTATVLGDSTRNTSFEGSTNISIYGSYVYDPGYGVPPMTLAVTFTGAINGASRRASTGGGETFFKGSTNIEITDGLYQNAIAGGFYFEESAKGNHIANLEAATTVTLNSGSFWRVVGGSYSLAGGNESTENQKGDSKVVIKGGMFMGNRLESEQQAISFVAGGSFFRNNAGTNTHTGNTAVEISGGYFGYVEGYEGLQKADTVHIVGGDYVNFNGQGGDSPKSSITGDTSVSISEDSSETSIYGIVVGGTYATDTGTGGSATIGGTSSVTIDGGTITPELDEGNGTTKHDHNGIAIVAGSMLVDEGDAIGDHTLSTANTAVTVNGGTINGHIVGGHYATDAQGGTNKLTITDTTTINLTGGSIAGNIIGGHYSANVESPDELNLGTVTITLEQGTGSTLVVNGDIIGGSRREAERALEETAGAKQNKGAVTIALTSGTLNGDVWAAGYHVNDAALTAHTASTEVKIGSGFTFAGDHTISGGYYKGTSDKSTVGTATLTFGDASYKNLGSLTFKDFSEIKVTETNATVDLSGHTFETEFETLTKIGNGALTLGGLSYTGSTQNHKLGLTVSEGTVNLASDVTLGAVSVTGTLNLDAHTLTASSLDGAGTIALSNSATLTLEKDSTIGVLSFDKPADNTPGSTIVLGGNMSIAKINGGTASDARKITFNRMATQTEPAKNVTVTITGGSNTQDDVFKFGAGVDADFKWMSDALTASGSITTVENLSVTGTAQLKVGAGSVVVGKAFTTGNDLSIGTGSMSVGTTAQISGETTINGGSLTLGQGGSIGTLSGTGGSLELSGGTLKVKATTATLTSLTLGGTLELGSNSGVNQLTLGSLVVNAGAVLKPTDLDAETALIKFSGANAITRNENAKLKVDLSGMNLKTILVNEYKEYTFALFSGVTDWTGWAEANLDLPDIEDLELDLEGWGMSFKEGSLVFKNLEQGGKWVWKNDEGNSTWNDDNANGWTQDEETPKHRVVHFVGIDSGQAAAGGATINVDSDVTPAGVEVGDGTYTFTGDGTINASPTPVDEDDDYNGKWVIGGKGKADVTLNVATSGFGTFELAEGGSLTLEHKDALGADGKIVFTGGTVVYGDAYDAKDEDLSSRFEDLDADDTHTAAVKVTMGNAEKTWSNANGVTVTLTQGLEVSGDSDLTLDWSSVDTTKNDPYAGAFALGSAVTLTANDGKKTLALSGAITGDGDLTLDGDGGYSLSGDASKYEGTLTLSSATAIAGEKALGGEDTTLVLNGGAVSAAAAAKVQAGTVIVQKDTALSGEITLTGDLKDGVAKVSLMSAGVQPLAANAPAALTAKEGSTIALTGNVTGYSAAYKTEKNATIDLSEADLSKAKTAATLENELIGEGTVVVGNAVTKLTGAMTGSVSVKNVGADAVTLAGDGSALTGGSLSGAGGFILDEGAKWGGKAVTDTALTLKNGKLENGSALTATNATITADVAAGKTVDVNGMNGALMNGGITVKANAQLLNVAGKITAGGTGGVKVKLVFGETGTTTTVSGTRLGNDGDYLITGTGSLHVADAEGFVLDFSKNEFVKVLLDHREKNTETWLHIYGGGELSFSNDFYDAGNLRADMLRIITDENSLAQMLSTLGFSISQLVGGDLGLVGNSREVYLVSGKGAANDAEVNGWEEGLGGYKATVVDSGATLDVFVDDAGEQAGFGYTWDPATQLWKAADGSTKTDEELQKEGYAQTQLAGRRNDQLNGGRTVNNLVGLEGSTLHAHNDHYDGTDATRERVVFNNAEVQIDDIAGTPDAAQGSVRGQDTEFDGVIVGEAGVDFVKKGAGTLTVGSAGGEGGLDVQGDVTLTNGGLTVRGTADTADGMNHMGNLVFDYEDDAQEDGFLFTNGSVTKATGILETNTGNGAEIGITEEAQLILSGESDLHDTHITGDGSGSLQVTGQLTFTGDGAADSVLSDVNVSVTDGGSLALNSGAGVSGGDITVSGDGSAISVGTGSKLSTDGALTAKDGGLLDLGRSTGNTAGALQGDGVLSSSGGELSITGKGGVFSGTLTGDWNKGGTITVQQGADLKLDNVTTDRNLWNVGVQENGKLTVDVSSGTNVQLGDITLNGGAALDLAYDPETAGSLSGKLHVNRANGQPQAKFTVDVLKISSRVDELSFDSLYYDGSLDDIDFTLTGVGAQHYAGELTMRANGSLYVAMEKVTENAYRKPALEKNVAAGAELLWDLTDPDSTAFAYAYGPGKGQDLYNLANATALLTLFGTDMSNTFAAVAGSSIATLSSAFDQDLQRQLNTMRNRSTSVADTAAAQSFTMHAWLNAESGYSKVKSEGYAPGFTLNGWGGTVGVSMDMQDGASIGVALSAMYNDLKASAADAGRGDLDTTWLSAYARMMSGSWSHSLIVSLGVADVKLNRTVDYGMGSYRTKGETDGYGLGLMYEVGCSFALNEQASLVLQPIANVQVRYESLDGYNETRSDAGLRVKGMEHKTVTFGLGARLQGALSENAFGRVSFFETRALVKLDAGDVRGNATNALLHGALEQEVESSAVGRAAFELGAGFSLPLGSGSAFFIDASFELRNRANSLNASAGYRLSF